MSPEASPERPIGALENLFGDLSDLVRKEIRLARAELADKAAHAIQSGLWMAAAGFLALIALWLLIHAIVFGIASLGVALHWAYLIVAVLFAAAAAGAFFYGRSMASEPFRPARTLRQVNEDIRAVREQLR
jgi:uncharacterized membrane protein YqjE